MTMTTRQQQPQRITKSVYNSVNLRYQTSFAPPEGFLLLIPFFTPALECARTIIASIMMLSMSGSAAKCSKIAVQIPRSDQLFKALADSVPLSVLFWEESRLRSAADHPEHARDEVLAGEWFADVEV